MNAVPFAERPISMMRIILSTVILLIGLALTVGGVWLATLGGTWGYIVLGALLLLSALLLFTKRKSGLLIYGVAMLLSLIHISEPTRRTPISYAVFCLKK